MAEILIRDDGGSTIDRISLDHLGYVEEIKDMYLDGKKQLVIVVVKLEEF